MTRDGSQNASGAPAPSAGVRVSNHLTAILQEGFQRLSAMPTGSLTSAMIANYAKKVSEDTGLKEDVARAAIEAWSAGLDSGEGIG